MLTKARKLHTCKKCRGDIWPNAFYYPQRRGKPLCFNCGQKPSVKTFFTRLLKWVGSHGE